jgi:dihydroneopterin aldolase
MDIIFIHDFRLDILIGIYDWERKVPQTVQFDLDIGIPARAGPVEKIGDTIDYAKVTASIEGSLRGNHFPLVEKLAEHVAQLVLREFKTPWVRVSVTKLAALRSVKRLGVTIERGNKA